MDGFLSDDACAALLKVAEAAAVLFRPPYRRGAGIQDTAGAKESLDFDRLFEALNHPDCPVEIGEMLT